MDPKKIATIEVNIVNATEAAKTAAEAFAELTPTDWRTIFLDEQHNCPLCGGELLLTAVTHFVNQQVNEEAICEQCNVKTREQAHQLQ